MLHNQVPYRSNHGPGGCPRIPRPLVGDSTEGGRDRREEYVGEGLLGVLQGFVLEPDGISRNRIVQLKTE